MSNYADVVVLVEGPTEQRFVKEILAPELASRVFLTPIILDKPGEKGGDVKFARAKNDIGRHLKQRSDTWVTLLVDYYGIRNDWPGYFDAASKSTGSQKEEVICRATAAEVNRLYPELNTGKRFIPYFSMHEIEALYFSDPSVLADRLNVRQSLVEAILDECGSPEQIDNSPLTAPSKRLEALCPRFKKTTTGITIAASIGLASMRAQCPLFNTWLSQLEALTEFAHATP